MRRLPTAPALFLALCWLSLTLILPIGAAAAAAPGGIEELARHGLWSSVHREARRALQGQPGDPDLLLWAVRGARRSGALKEARETADQALARHPAHAGLRLERAWLHALQGEWQRTIADAELAVDAAPQDADTLLLLGIAQRELHDWPAALATFQRAARLRPDDDDIRLNLARAQLEGGHAPQAATLLDPLLQRRPDSYEALLLRGRCRAALGNASEASRDLTRAIQLEPERAVGYRTRAELLERAGMWAEAARDARAALLLDERDLPARLLLCRDSERRGDWSSLHQQALALVELAPDNPQAHRFLGRALAAAGSDQPALAAYDRALALIPADVDLRLERAALHSSAGRHAAAIEDCTVALRRQPTALGYALRGFARFKQGDHARAEEDAGNALVLDERTVAALLVRAEVRLALGQGGDALRDARKAVALAPDQAWGQVVHGKALLAAGEARPALAAADRAVALAPRDATTYALRARCHLSLGDRTAARADRGVVVRLDPALAMDLERDFAALRSP